VIDFATESPIVVPRSYAAGPGLLSDVDSGSRLDNEYAGPLSSNRNAYSAGPGLFIWLSPVFFRAKPKDFLIFFLQ